MYNKTIWKENIKPLLNNKKIKKQVDVLIIGGGIAGMTALYQLSETKKNILLIDKGRIGFGVSANTTGKITYLQDEIYEQIENMYHFEIAKKYLYAQLEAINFLKNVIKKEQIDCDFQRVDSYVFANKKEELSKVQYLKNFLTKCQIEVKEGTKIPLSVPCFQSLKITNSYVFHPVKYIYGLARICLSRGMQINENVRAYDIDKKENLYFVKTNLGIIQAKQVLVCTHYPFFVKPGWIPFKTHLESSYVLATKVKNPEKFSAITITKPISSFRYHSDVNHYLIFASMSDLLTKCKSSTNNFNEAKYNFSLFCSNNPEYQWETHDVMTNDHLPFIGPVSKQNKNLLIATGFQKWGMTNGTLSGMILSDYVLEKNNQYANLFLPYRNFSFKRCMNTVKDGFEVMKAMFCSLIKNQEKQVRIEYKNAKRIGIYTDEYGKEHCVSTLCPHMKCHLLFNEIELTWDCPCHGSRFDIDGNLIEGPSVFDIHENSDVKKK